MFSWMQLELLVAIIIALTVLGYVLRSIDKGAGAWLLLISACALAVGQVLRAREAT